MVLMSETYVVTGEYITVQTATAQGPRVVGLSKGTRVPDDVSEESIEHHLRKGLIAEAEDAEEELAAEPEPEVPARSASKAEWVDYAVSQGVARESAEAITRDELVEKLGG